MSATRCHHICRCGAELRCACEPDMCAAGANWECPACEAAEFEAWINLQERAQELRKYFTLKPHTSHTQGDDTP